MIKTTENSDYKVRLYSSGDGAGRVILDLSKTPPEYELYDCKRNGISLGENLPSETERIWEITKLNEAGTRVIVLCNGVKVVDQTCDYEDGKEKWKKKVSHVEFNKDSYYIPELRIGY